MYEFMRAIQGADHFIILQQRLCGEFTLHQAINCWCKVLNKDNVVRLNLHRAAQSLPGHPGDMMLDVFFKRIHEPDLKNHKIFAEASGQYNVVEEWKAFMKWIRDHFFAYLQYRSINHSYNGDIELKQQILFDEKKALPSHPQNTVSIKTPGPSVASTSIVQEASNVKKKQLPSFWKWRKFLGKLPYPYDMIARIVMKNGEEVGMSLFLNIRISQIDFDAQTITYNDSKHQRVISYPPYIMNKLKTYIDSTEKMRKQELVFINAEGVPLSITGIVAYYFTKRSDKMFSFSKIRNYWPMFKEHYTLDEIIGYQEK